jgi:peptide/nickel transport system permease protein
MLLFISKRIGFMMVLMLVVSMLLFGLFEINVEKVAVRVIGQYSTLEQRAIWLEQNGYNDPLVARYFNWLGNAVTGDFGRSVKYAIPVSEILWPRVWNTVILAFCALAIIVPLSLTLGILAGMKEGSNLDRVITVVSIMTTSVPEFASAVLLAAVFVFGLNLLPGTSSMADGFNLVELILPTLVLVLFDVGYVARMTRASMAEVMTTQYVRTAILMGLPYRRVIWKYALRNALITPFTIIMLQVNWLLSGVIVVEIYFAYKGFGALILEAALTHDIYLIEACTLVAVLVAVGTQTIADVAYTYLNPRIRFT